MNRIEPHIPGGCSVAGILNEKKGFIKGEQIIKMITVMHERSNGLGGGFAGWGIYPDNKDDWCFHLFFDNEKSREFTEEYLKHDYEIMKKEEIPTRKVKVIDKRPLIWRYFLRINREKKNEFYELTEEDIVMNSVMKINEEFEGAFVVSSGKNMGVFKGVGYPEDIAEFYRIDDYQAYLWIAHGRFPTNTPGWWGGAHPFGLLNWALVHNGEISSYGTNKRYLEGFGYRLMLQTDSEAILYLFDLLLRKHNLPFEIACMALAPLLWDEIERMNEEEKQLLKAIRMVYGSALINGPSSLILGYKNGMLGLNDRIKLRPLIAGRKDDLFYLSSEECGIREICPEPDKIWAPKAGEPAIGELKL